MVDQMTVLCTGRAMLGMNTLLMMMIMCKGKSFQVLESFSLNALGVITAGGSLQPEGK